MTDTATTPDQRVTVDTALGNAARILTAAEQEPVASRTEQLGGLADSWIVMASVLSQREIEL